MGLRDCLISAAEQGAITRQEALELADDFETRHSQISMDMGDAAALAEAKKQLAASLRARAIDDRRTADLTEAARLTLKGRIIAQDGSAWKTAMGVLSHYGLNGNVAGSVRGRAEAVTALAHARIADVMFTFRRSGVMGKRENMAMVPDFVAELHGRNSGDATAKALAQAVSGVFEELRLRFNAAGGAIGKLDNFGLPHSHDRALVKKAGRDAWKAAIRPKLDPAKMIDALTGQPISPARLEAALDHAWENIVSEGRAHMTANAAARGKGAIASQRMDERFFVFRTDQDWLDYHQAFGKGDVIQAVFGHVNAMAKDIAAMELLGPNPAAMVEWLIQMAESEIGQREAGLLSGKAAMSEAALARHRISALWTTLRGQPAVISGAVTATGTVTNVTNAAILGGVGALSAATDPFVARAARRLADLPVTSTIKAMLDMTRRQSRDEIVRSGVVWDEYLHVMADEMRGTGPALGAEWSRWLVDRAVTWNGLKPLTTGRKLVEARAWQGHVADLARAGTGFAGLQPGFRHALESFGVTPADWDIWTASIDRNGFVTPMEIMARGGAVSYGNAAPLSPAGMAEAKALAHRAAAEKLAELTTSWGERAVPTGTPNSRSVVTGGFARGTVQGELMHYFLGLKSFGLSFTALQLEAQAEMALRGGNKARLAYLAGLAVPLTIGGALYNQFKLLADGRDPEDMTEPAFWLKATVTGGGFGLAGDFFKATENRFGQSPLEALAGPSLAYLFDSFWILRANAEAAMGGQSALRDNIAYGKRWTPIVSSHPVTRAAWNRLVLDNLQFLGDPEADKSFKRKIAAAKSAGAPYFLPPGSFTPGGKPPKARLGAPDFTGVIDFTN